MGSDKNRVHVSLLKIGHDRYRVLQGGKPRSIPLGRHQKASILTRAQVEARFITPLLSEIERLQAKVESAREIIAKADQEHAARAGPDWNPDGLPVAQAISSPDVLE